ncbi:MAG: hypothetical protein HZB98_06185 [Bacteroidia bacterium]|nr:hypothetical protein [Bacteroidia bacterium]
MKIDYAELNEDHCRRVDKLYRQFAGLASEIISYRNKTLELEIRISSRWPKDPETTAKQISKDWRSAHECLKKAKFYKVKLVFLGANQDTGGTFSINQYRSSMIQEITDILDKMKSKGENKSVLITGSIDHKNQNQK